MRNLEWQSEAWSEYAELQQNEKAKLRRVNSLLKDIMRNVINVQKESQRC
jgi:toxin YoeB